MGGSQAGTNNTVSEWACGAAAVGRVTANGGLDRQQQRDRKKWIHSRDLESNMYNSP